MCVIKKEPKLNHTAVYTSNLERQRVPPALAIFHETTIASVREFDSSEIGKSTADFLQVFSNFF